MEEYVSIVRGIEMGSSFQFYCVCCELNMILYEGIKKNPKINCVNFFCFNCSKISHHDQCGDCGERLLYSIKIPEEAKKIKIEEEISLEIRLRCPKCSSQNTILTKLGEWGY